MGIPKAKLPYLDILQSAFIKINKRPILKLLFTMSADETKTRKSRWTETMLDALIAGVGDHEAIINPAFSKK